MVVRAAGIVVEQELESDQSAAQRFRCRPHPVPRYLNRDHWDGWVRQGALVVTRGPSISPRSGCGCCGKYLPAGMHKHEGPQVDMDRWRVSRWSQDCPFETSLWISISSTQGPTSFLLEEVKLLPSSGSGAHELLTTPVEILVTVVSDCYAHSHY